MITSYVKYREKKNKKKNVSIVRKKNKGKWVLERKHKKSVSTRLTQWEMTINARERKINIDLHYKVWDDSLFKNIRWQT